MKLSPYIFGTHELWDELMERKLPIIAMRTVAGGNVHRLRDVPGAAWRPYLVERARLIAPIFERSGIKTWSEFCLRFAHSIPGVLASVGSTSRPDGLAELLAHARDPQPLPLLGGPRGLRLNLEATETCAAFAQAQRPSAQKYFASGS